MKTVYSLSTKDAEKLGHALAKGAVRYLVGAAVCVWITVLLIQAVINALGIWTDDCDLDAWHRCGVAVVTDHKTGVQYLMSPDGGLVRRAPISEAHR